MSSSTSNWLVLAGAAVLLVGICALLPLATGRADPDQLMAGAGLFSLGSLTLSSGIYLKSRTAKPFSQSGQENEPAPKPVRGGCELCGTEAPVIQCKIHQLQLCGNCLNNHYDVRSCIYVPARRSLGKGSKAVAAKAR